MNQIKYYFTNGQIWSGELHVGQAVGVESSIGLNAFEKNRIREAAKTAAFLGVDQVHFNDGAKLTVEKV